ncbi:chemotaxis protein CheW [uncultured Methanospirillum sp.]|uniref:chemotaxis protein CheW n=1 Tax=uncultured Methanospirillum sp. TaxID=262503 RepID=UPI0029C937BB|nr:chemotaxis protein CheW [uncultured Methanospirillum sp.]
MEPITVKQTDMRKFAPDSGISRGRDHISYSRIKDTEQVVEFGIGDEMFAVDLFDTREVITTPDVTPIPNVPEFITGIIDLRGMITTIIDLRVMMHITRESTGKRRSRVIVLDKTVSDKMIGILVDDVYSVTTYYKNDIDQEAHSSSEGSRDILGVIRKHRKDGRGKDKNVLVIWLDIKKMIQRIEKDL